MALPTMTPEQRAAALANAAAARKERAIAKAALKSGDTTLSAVLDSTDSPLQGARIREVLLALPGVGAVKANGVMERIGITQTRRVRGLSGRQRQALKDEFEPARA